MIYVVLTFLGFCAGCGVIWLKLEPKLKQTEKINEEIKSLNLSSEKRLEELLSRQSNLKDRIKELSNTYDEKLESLKTLTNTINETADNYLLEQLKLQDLRLEKAEAETNNQIECFNEEYQEVVQDALKAYDEKIALKKNALELLQNSYGIEARKVLAAVEANKRAEEIKNNQNYYKLVLSKEDLEEVANLKECTKYFRNSEPLNKVIWKMYYEKPCSDLIGRVVGSNIKTGIYKITNLNNGMCYVGQAVNIAERWKQHIKRGLGADTPTRNKLYPAMAEFGVENFSFEIIEECTKPELNEREDFWQEHFKAKEFGYSIK